MTYEQAANLLIEKEVTPQLTAFTNRLVLRIFSSTSLQAYFYDLNVVKEKSNDDVAVIQLDFHKLPQEVIPSVIQLIASPTEPKVYEFEKNHQTHTGFEFSVDKADFPEDRYAGED